MTKAWQCQPCRQEVIRLGPCTALVRFCAGTPHDAVILSTQYGRAEGTQPILGPMDSTSAIGIDIRRGAQAPCVRRIRALQVNTILFFTHDSIFSNGWSLLNSRGDSMLPSIEAKVLALPRGPPRWPAGAPQSRHWKRRSTKAGQQYQPPEVQNY